MLLELLRFLGGYVRFEVIGRFPERFLNITAASGVRIWRTERSGDRLFSSMYMSDYRRIRLLARKSRVRLRVREKHGVPIVLRRHRDRMGVAVGVLAFTLTVQVMSMFVWSIDVVGCERLSRTEVIDALRDESVYVGAFRPALDFQRIGREIEMELDDIGWLALNVSGSHLSVEIKEYQRPVEVSDPDRPANVKAKKDGRILKMNVRQGKKYLLEGSGVVKDQLIVSGVIPDRMGGVTLVRSDADVIAETKTECGFTVSKTRESIIPGQEKTRYRAGIPGISVPVTAAVGAPLSIVREYTESPYYLETFLPLYLTRESVTALEKHTVTMDKNSAKELLMKDAALFEAFALCSCEVTERGEKLTETDEGFSLTVSYTCMENIAYQEEIGVDENTDRRRPEPTQAQH